MRYTDCAPPSPVKVAGTYINHCAVDDYNVIGNISGFGGLGVSVLAYGTQVRGFKPGRSSRIFKGGKILSTPSFGREVKPWIPCRKIIGK
jgi:hypothetical protein